MLASQQPTHAPPSPPAIILPDAKSSEVTPVTSTLTASLQVRGLSFAAFVSVLVTVTVTVAVSVSVSVCMRQCMCL